MFDEALEYLDGLRETGITNMYGAGEYLERKFDLTKGDARKILAHWMETFGDRHPQ